MIIIVEGLDRCGKSTAVNHLREIIKSPRILTTHCSKPPSGVDKLNWSIDFYRFWFQNMEAIEFIDGIGISDRSHIGETVYGPLYRGYNADWVWEMERQFKNENWYLILLTDDPLAISMRDDGLGIETDVESLSKTKAKFIESFHKSEIPNKLHIDYDLDGYSLSDLPKLLKEFIYAERF